MKQKRPESFNILRFTSVKHLKTFKAISKSHADLMDSLYDPSILARCPFSHLRDSVNSTCGSSLRSCLVHQHTNAKQLHMHRAMLCNKYIAYVPALRQSRKLNEFSKFCQALNGRLHSCIYRPSLIKTH